MAEKGRKPAGALPPEARPILLSLAREAAESFVREGKRIEPRGDAPWMTEERGVFVTLKKKGQLRGCIGHPFPVMPLGKAIVENAISSASRDPRFPAVKPAELDEIHIELSVLTVPVAGEPAEVEVGRHGLIVSAKGQRGLLLPQVASENGWDAETFLDHTCLKAGLPTDAWRHGAELELFEAEVFGE